MSSANGYALEVNGFTLTAAWPAPFYALCLSEGPDGPDEPLLIHCETLADAQGKRPTFILDAEFNRV